LIQKLDYVTRGFVSDAGKISEVELEQFFVENKNNYLIDASITFTHVFFDSKKHGSESAMTQAQETLQHLNDKKVPFDKAPSYGDRFLFHRNYVDRTPKFVETHFGGELGKKVFDLPISNQQWHGPLLSNYGVHLVMAIKNQRSRSPELEEVAGGCIRDRTHHFIEG
jgi:PPIC-type PPIASE domain